MADILCVKDDTPMQDLGNDRYRCPKCGIEMYLSEEYKENMIERSNHSIIQPPNKEENKLTLGVN